MVRPPRPVRELQTRILQVSHELGQEADAASLARALGESIDAVREALAARGCFQPSSLDAPVGESEYTLADRMPASLEQSYEGVEERVAVGAALRSLDDRSKRMLRLRFFDGMSQQQLAVEFDTTQVQISRELRRILARVRQLAGVEQALTA